MNTHLLDNLPIYVFYFGIVVFILVSFEVGYLIGKHTRKRWDTEASSGIGPMVGGALGMLAFVLAFTFSMAASQNDLRKQNVLNEANAIGTAYLRADLIDEQHGMEIKRLLRDYVNARLGVNKENIGEALAKSIELHGLLWEEVASVAATAPNTNTSLLIQAINEVIDMHEKRVTAVLFNRIPATIHLTLLIITALTMMMMGVQSGLSGPRRLIAIIPLALAFAALSTVVVDLDRPHRGLVKINQQAMINLQTSMKSNAK